MKTILGRILDQASFSIISSINCFILCILLSKKEITSISGAYLKLVICGIESFPIDLATRTFKEFLCVPIFLSLIKQYNQSIPSTVGFNRDCKSLCSLLNFSLIFLRLISYRRSPNPNFSFIRNNNASKAPIKGNRTHSVSSSHLILIRYVFL